VHPVKVVADGSRPIQADPPASSSVRITQPESVQAFFYAPIILGIPQGATSTRR
jgi:hypothetical protein